MNQINKKTIVPYTSEQMFKIVNRVDSYPAFLPWCSDADIESESESQMIATVYIAKGPLKQKFTTRNILEKYNFIKMELVDGPFSFLEGTWLFEDIGTNKCQVSFDLEFEFKRDLISKLLEPIFSSAVNTMVESFKKRAYDKYGI